MANFHSRSNSFTSQSHPIVNDVEDHLCRLRASEATSTSTSFLCKNLASLRELHEGINNMNQMPSIQQALSHGQSQSWVNELLEGSLKLIDLCEFTREVVCLTKESVQNFESSIRRNRGEENNIKAHVASRKNISKMVNKYMKNLKSFNKNSRAIPDVEFRRMLNETEGLVSSILKSALTLISGENNKSMPRNWSFVSKFTKKKSTFGDRQL